MSEHEKNKIKEYQKKKKKKKILANYSVQKSSITVQINFVLPNIKISKKTLKLDNI